MRKPWFYSPLHPNQLRNINIRNEIRMNAKVKNNCTLKCSVIYTSKLYNWRKKVPKMYATETVMCVMKQKKWPGLQGDVPGGSRPALAGWRCWCVSAGKATAWCSGLWRWQWHHATSGHCWVTAGSLPWSTPSPNLPGWKARAPLGGGAQAPKATQQSPLHSNADPEARQKVIH